jgi:VWFA-related protein
MVPASVAERFNMHRMYGLAALAIVVSLLSPAVGAQQPQDRQPPVFRAGAHFVRVDVYPSRDGRPLAGLRAEDFELLEDGKAQTIETFEFIEFPTYTTNADRRDPNSQRGGFELARDPQYRIFVLYLDAFHVAFSGSNRVSLPIVEFLNRMVGPSDLFGVLTPAQTPDDLMLGQLTQTVSQQLTDHPMWGIADRYEPQPGEIELEAAFPRPRGLAQYLIALRRLDKVYSDLEGLVARLGDLRDERKNIVFFSDALGSPRPGFSQMAIDPTGGTGVPPRIGVNSDGKLTLGRLNKGEIDMRAAEIERTRLTSIDFERRFRDLLRSARQANVSFYTVRPGGLDANYSLMSTAISNLQLLAEETDGAAVSGSNDVRPGLRRIADDQSSHYVLGYYTSNTNWNGATRQITVKLRSTGENLRARREYRAPTEAEMAAIRNVRSAADAPAAAPSPVATALDTLARLRPAAPFSAYGTAVGSDVAIVAEIAAAEIEGGRWKQGADVQVMLAEDKGETRVAKGRIEPGARGTVIKVAVGSQAGPWQAMVRITGSGQPPQTDSVMIARRGGTLLGDPIAYRAGAPASAPWRALAAFHLRRTERLRIDWPVLAEVTSHDGRLLDRKGQPLDVPVTVESSGEGSSKIVTATLNLAPLSIGEYVVELTARSGETVERKLVAIRVSMAR